jgi:hypothetical protein
MEHVYLRSESEIVKAVLQPPIISPSKLLDEVYDIELVELPLNIEDALIKA